MPGKERARTSSAASEPSCCPCARLGDGSVSNSSHLFYESSAFSNQKRSLLFLGLVCGVFFVVFFLGSQTLGIIIKIMKYKHALEGSCRENNRRLVFDK